MFILLTRPNSVIESTTVVLVYIYIMLHNYKIQYSQYSTMYMYIHVYM